MEMRLSCPQAEANLEVTAARIKEDTAGLAAREARTKQEEERLDREKRELTRDKSAFEEERDRVGRLGLEVRQRSQEIEELCTVRVPCFFRYCFVQGCLFLLVCGFLFFIREGVCAENLQHSGIF